MLAILNSFNAHNSPIFEPISMILVSKFKIHRVLSDKTYLSLRLLSPLIANSADLDEMLHYVAFHLGLHCLPKYQFRGFLSKKGLIQLN